MAGVDERRALGELVTRHLSDVVPVPGGGEVCIRPITTGIYRVFLDDVAAAGAHRPPDTHADGVATGMWQGDALAFVAWVNDLVGEARYRLPTRTELDDPGVAGALPDPYAHRVWLDPADPADPAEPQPLWRSPGFPHPHKIGASVLRRYHFLDFERPAATFAPFLLSWVKARGDGLAGSLRWAGDLAGDLDDARTRALTTAYDQADAPTLPPGLAPALAPDLARAREHALDLAAAPNLTEARAYAGTLARTLDAVATRYRDLAADRARDFDRALADAPDQDGELRRDVSSACDEAYRCAEDLSRIIDRAPGQVGATARAIELDGDGAGEVRALLEQILTPGVVTGMLCAVSKILWDELYTADRVVERIAATLARAIKADQTPRLDDLADLVRAGARGFDKPDTQGPDLSRARRVAARLEELAVPILERREPLTADRAATIRILALCLAFEADTLSSVVDPATGDAYREVAAGVTLREQRQSGAAAPAEVILLARASSPAHSTRPRRTFLRRRHA